MPMTETTYCLLNDKGLVNTGQAERTPEPCMPEPTPKPMTMPKLQLTPGPMPKPQILHAGSHHIT